MLLCLRLDSFHNFLWRIKMKNILITGTNRGIGLEFVKQLIVGENYLLATCRNKTEAYALQSLQERSPKKLTILELDLSNPHSLENFHHQIGDSKIDIFINNAGIYGPGFYKPEDARTKFGFKNLKEGIFDINAWTEVFQVNTIAPLLITKAIADNIKKGKEKKLVFVSSLMGSIKENKDGGHYIYRTSKAALNQLVKGLSIDLYKENITAICVHPGWVKTDMGGEIADLDVSTSVSALLKVIEKTGFEDTGKFFNYDFSEINW